ncbi:hypothetical protein C4578_00065 [Candidatus Microgenomates bacterium]|jgi:hypothetical protein|nr:MAG: hypothetical protein C4578_00065 [Candidatus Microgenomates bacterium]
MEKENNNKETSEALIKTLESYSKLSLGGKTVRAPYWMNKLKLGIFGPFGGKGRPEDLISSVKTEAEKKGIKLEKLSEEEILSFMKRKKIGVDCSGFVFWMLDSLDRERGGNGIADDIPGSKGKFLSSRANAQMLTSKEVVVPVEKVKDIKPGDVIRLRGGQHLAVVVSVTKNGGKVIEVEYAHSSFLSKEKGVHLQRIEVTDEDKGIGEQIWLEQTDKGENYKEAYFMPEKGDGVKRLKIWS